MKSEVEVDKTTIDYQVGYANGYAKGYEDGHSEGYSKAQKRKNKIKIENRKRFENEYAHHL